MAAYEVLLLNTAIPQIQAAQAGDTYVCPRDIQITANLDVTGNTILGDASTDTVRVNGYMGVGGAGTANAAVYLTSTALTGTSQYGFYSTPRASSAATSQAAGFTALVRTEAAAFTLANAYGLSVENVTKGAGSTITNQHGLYVADQTQGTNNFGVTSAVSSGANKWNIYASGTAANYFAGDLRVGTTTAFASEKLSVFGSTFNDLAAGNGSANTSYDWLVGVSGNVVYPAKIVVDQGSSSTIHGMSFYTSNATLPTEKMRISADGNVGIGTTSPEYKLQVSGTTGQTFSIERVASSIGSSTSLGTIVGTGEIPTLTADGASIQFVGAGTWSATSAPGRIVFNTTPVSATTPVERFQLAAGEAVFNDPGNDYDFRVESDTNTHAFFVQGSDGFVGIGTNAPQSILDVVGVSGTEQFRIGNTLGGTDFGITVTENLSAIINSAEGAAGRGIQFQSGGTNTLLIDASGNVGIGTNAPVTFGKLAVVGSVDVNNTVAFRTNDPTVNNTSFNSIVDITGTAKDSGGVVRYNNTTIEALGSTSNGGTLVFRTDDSSAVLQERMRIDSSGNVRVGTAALATTATDGFLYIPTCAGTPTGTPTAITGLAPMVIDSTNNKLYIYSGGAWVALN